MPEPTLSEISNINTDPALSGVAPEPIIDNTHVVDQLNQNAKFHAQQVANKYNIFLQNKKDMIANIGDIEGLETLPEDKEVLRKQAADILEQIGKDPSAITGGAGFNEVMAKMSKFKSNSMASKQAFLDDKTHKVLLETTPEMDTPENRALLQNEKKKPIAERKGVLLNTPTIMDERSIFEKTIKDATQPYVENVIGKDGMHYINTGFEFNPNTFNRQWELVGSQTDKNNKQLSGAIKYNYDHLPKSEKDKYEEEGGGGIEQFWKDRGQKYVDAHLPPESNYEKTAQGNVRFGKTSKQDTEWIAAQRLEQQEKHQQETERQGRERLNIEYERLGVEKEKLKNANDNDKQGGLTVIRTAANILNNATPLEIVGKGDKTGKTKRTILRISDPTLLEEFGKISKEGKRIEIPDAINYDPETNQPVLVYFNDEDKASGKTDGVNYKKEIPLDQRQWLNVIARRQFKNPDGVNKSVSAILDANDNSMIKISQKLKNPAPEQGAESKSYKIKGKGYTKADLISGGWTEEQFNQAVKSGKIK